MAQTFNKAQITLDGVSPELDRIQGCLLYNTANMYVNAQRVTLM